MINRFTTFFFILTSWLFFQANLYAEPANLAQLLNEVQTYHDSGTYEKELNQVISQARLYINQRAKINEKQANPQKLAIVLDIDETSLSNYQMMAAHSFLVSKEEFRQAILASNAPQIKATLALYKDAISHGVSVFFVTGRKESERAATDKNLAAAGYKNWTGLFLKPNNYKLSSIIPFKSNARANITNKGYTIIASIGDQWSDLKGGYAEKIFKLPNPYYFLP